MSLPSSETLPANINELPPARQRHIRRQPGAASPPERQLLLDSLLEQTGPTLNFFLLWLFGSLFFGLALYFNEPTVLLLGLVAMPFLRPVFGLALFPNAHKLSHWIKSLISLLFPILITFFVGVLAGYLQKTGEIDRLDAYRFSAPYWLDAAAVIGSTIVCTLILLRQGQLPRKISIVLSYEILFPIALAGFGFTLGYDQIWPGALLVALLHLVLAITVAIITFLFLGFGPKRFTGWIFALLPLILTIILVLSGVNFNVGNLPIPTSTNPLPQPTLTSQPSATPSERAVAFATSTTAPPTKTSTPTASATPTSMPSPTTTLAPTLTATPQPTTFIVIIDSLNGVVIRETADFQSPVIGYANNGDIITIIKQGLSENDSLWYQIQISQGETGWILASLANTQTPIPTQEN